MIIEVLVGGMVCGRGHLDNEGVLVMDEHLNGWMWAPRIPFDVVMRTTVENEGVVWREAR